MSLQKLLRPPPSKATTEVAMSCARLPCKTQHPNRRLQKGAAFIVMLVILVLGVTTILVSSLTGYSLRMGREQITAESLAKAREALISYAVNSENFAGLSPRPGNLPCPDTDAPNTAGYGDAEGSCAAGAIGRLPWKTLGIPELMDESGQPLWYAISGNFRAFNDNPNPINSDTAGTLDVYDNDGTTLLTLVGSKAVAIVFAPGQIVGAQQRGTAAEKTAASNYLETGGTGTSRNNATENGPFVAAIKSPTFNDRLLFITQDQLMLNVEKRVAGEIRQHLNSYFASWNAYPFAAIFADPSGATYKGVAATYEGLYPFGSINGIGTQPISPAWNAVPSISFSGGIIGSISCSLTSGYWPNSRARCSATTGTITIPSGVTVTMTGRLNNVGLGFWKLHDLTDTNQFRARNSIGITVLASSLLDNVAITGSLNYADGSATLTFTGQGKSGGSTLQRLEFRDIQYQASPLPAWFAVNHWNEVMYYAVSPGFAPGNNACTPLPATPSCLSVTGSGSGANKRAIVIMTGKALASQSAHPTGNVADYLEGENATPADYIFENQNRSSTFNDQVLTVSP